MLVYAGYVCWLYADMCVGCMLVMCVVCMRVMCVDCMLVMCVDCMLVMCVAFSSACTPCWFENVHAARANALVHQHGHRVAST